MIRYKMFEREITSGNHRSYHVCVNNFGSNFNSKSKFYPIDEALSKDVIKSLDATHDHISNNNNKDNAYAAFDPDNQYIGDMTRLDEIHSLTIDGKSVNPLDSNWGGGHFTQAAVNKGYFNHKKKSPRG